MHIKYMIPNIKKRLLCKAKKQLGHETLLQELQELYRQAINDFNQYVENSLEKEDEPEFMRSILTKTAYDSKLRFNPPFTNVSYTGDKKTYALKNPYEHVIRDPDLAREIEVKNLDAKRSANEIRQLTDELDKKLEDVESYEQLVAAIGEDLIPDDIRTEHLRRKDIENATELRKQALKTVKENKHTGGAAVSNLITEEDIQRIHRIFTKMKMLPLK